MWIKDNSVVFYMKYFIYKDSTVKIYSFFFIQSEVFYEKTVLVVLASLEQSVRVNY